MSLNPLASPATVATSALDARQVPGRLPKLDAVAAKGQLVRSIPVRTLIADRIRSLLAEV
jgi:hypothetical protein